MSIYTYNILKTHHTVTILTKVLENNKHALECLIFNYVTTLINTQYTKLLH